MVVDDGETPTEPAVGSLPLHPPPAVQVVALVLVQVNVEMPPAAIDVGLADRIAAMDGVLSLRLLPERAELG